MHSFCFQQPGSAAFLDAIERAATGADEGAAMFAFASSGGVDAFFQVPGVADMLRQRKPFHLVVGIDAITNAEALLCIEDKRNLSRSALTAEVFIHEHPASTFHPKFVWFRHGDEVRLIAGSGNLTTRGLGIVSVVAQAPGNWEAFGEHVLHGAAARTTVQNLRNWAATQRAVQNLRLLNDEQVRARAMTNGLVRFSTGRLPGAGAGAAPVPVDDETFEVLDILVRELPKNRPGQADVGKTALSQFFGFASGAKDVLLQHVSLENHLGKTEKIRLFTNESQNYRLELRAMAGFPYHIGADDGRLILVATKLDRRSFRYTIVPVDSPAHTQLSNLLGFIGRGRRFMREKRVTGDELRASWPAAPVNLLPITVTTLTP